jgi:ABC-type Mn2+/Zn2+ transport system ATPase subunit
VTSDAPVIARTEGLVLAYGRKPVLRDVTLEVRAGQYWFFLGANGSGKTTLLRALLGILPPRDGRLWTDPEYAGPRVTGFVPQRCDLNPSLPTTVREFVLLGLVGLAVRGGERSDRLRAALEQVGLGSHVDASFWSLSGGQRQRALVARALVRRPRLFALDEPMSNLDFAAEDRLLAFLAALNRDERLTMLYVTHKLDVVRRYATHVALFLAGSVIAGEADAVLTPANLRRAFEGSDDEAPTVEEQAFRSGGRA